MPSTAPETARDLMEVAVGVIRAGDGRVLTAKRRPGTPGAGEWEFPGGKVEPGETGKQALARELAEEVGIRVKVCTPLISVRRAYPDRVVMLATFEVDAYEGEPHGREGQRLAWIEPENLSCPPLLTSSAAIVKAIQLPETYLITGADPRRPALFLSRLRAALRSGVRMLRLRCPELGDAAYRGLARGALALTREAGATLLLDREPALVEELGAGGLHLTSRRLLHLDARPVRAGWWLGASCHNADELLQAHRLGCDFAVLSPVAPTASHPGTPPLGWQAFADLVREAPLPVYALGGMVKENIPTARRRGGQGIAAMNSLM